MILAIYNVCRSQKGKPIPADKQLKYDRICHTFEKWYPQTKHLRCGPVYDHFITSIHQLSCSATNGAVKSMLEKISQTMQSRKALLWNALCDHNFLPQALNELSICSILEGLDAGSPALEKIFFIFKNMQLTHQYFTEIVQANALWHIAGTLDPCQKIAVIAGRGHIRALEGYLDNSSSKCNKLI